jgi:undecaprenyl-diphosphatase
MAFARVRRKVLCPSYAARDNETVIDSDAPTPSGAEQDGAKTESSDDRFVGGRDLTHWYTPLGKGLATMAKAVGSRLGPNPTLIITLIIGLSLVLALSFAAARIYDSVTEKDGVAGLDQPVLALAMRLRSPALDAVMTGYTNIAGPIGMPIIAVAVLTLMALHRKSWTPVILIAAAGTGSLLMTIAGKDIINRHRPPLADAVPPYEFSPSFPSGHTLNAVVIAGIIAYLLILRQNSRGRRALTITVAAVFAVTIGLSRVFLGHHWLTDVLAGFVLGAAWLTVIITAHRLYLTTRQKNPPTGARLPPGDRITS